MTTTTRTPAPLPIPATLALTMIDLLAATTDDMIDDCAHALADEIAALHPAMMTDALETALRRLMTALPDTALDAIMNATAR